MRAKNLLTECKVGMFKGKPAIMTGWHVDADLVTCGTYTRKLVNFWEDYQRLLPGCTLERLGTELVVIPHD